MVLSLGATNVSHRRGWLVVSTTRGRVRRCRWWVRRHFGTGDLRRNGRKGSLLRWGDFDKQLQITTGWLSELLYWTTPSLPGRGSARLVFSMLNDVFSIAVSGLNAT